MRRILPALLALAMLGSGCKESGTVLMQLHISGDDNKSPLRNPGTATRPSSDVETLSLEAKNANTGETQKKELTNDFSVSDRIDVGALKVSPGAGWRLTLTGVDRYGYLQGLGRSLSFEVPKKGEVQVPIVFGIADDFSTSGELGDGAGQWAQVNVLPDGAVLISGPGGIFVHDPRTGEVCGKDCLTGDLPAARSHHTAVTLKDGRVLIAGGKDSTGAALDDLWVFNASSRTFEKKSVTGFVGRFGAGAALLGDGRVAIAGGRGADASVGSSVQIVDVDAATVTTGAPLSKSLFQPAAVALNSGAVLLTGGFDDAGKPLADAVLIAADGTANALPAMAHARGGHSATVLSDGAVLIYGGIDAAALAMANPEVFIAEGNGGAFSEVQNSGNTAPPPRAGHAAVRIATGEVLVMGGEPASIAVPDPAKQLPVEKLDATKVGVNYLLTVTESGSSASRTGGAAVVLPDESVLLAGGARPALLDPSKVADTADWVKTAELFVPCALPGESCGR
ncbi:MAG: Kelch repeat-containing protein [Myxococcaceae bacterium]